MGGRPPVFQDGALVEAVRRGHLVILDEPNIAPSEVLEELNRLLDLNRELYVPRRRRPPARGLHALCDRTMRAATAGAGSWRAFRNRFIEPGRKLTVAEKAVDDVEEVVAAEASVSLRR